MEKSNKESRRDFIKKSAVAGSLMATPFAAFGGGKAAADEQLKGRSLRYLKSGHAFNGPYTGEHLERLAFPIGGIGAGMFCLEGSGSMAQLSIFNKPDIMNEPCVFAALHLKGVEKGSKVLEGPVPEWKKAGLPGANGSSARGAGRNSYGLPRFTNAVFRARFPYGLIELEDEDIPLGVQIRGWSPFIPTKEDDSSLPVGAFEYTFTNDSANRREVIFSRNAKHFIAADHRSRIRPTRGGFILEQPTEDPGSEKRASFACFVPGEEVKVDCKWFKGQWFDPLSMAWNKIESGNISENPVAYYERNPSIHSDYSEDAIALLKREGPKYQYGRGCLSDGILGMWIASCAGLRETVDHEKVTSHLLSVHRYNLIRDLSDHANPQRPTYAMGNEGGLILCSWPKGGRLSLPFVYSNEVWTGIEYQVASHLMMKGEVEKGLEIVRYCRSRYDGKVRNPFDEFECGHYYARAMASYGMLQGLTGIRYDAVEKTLYIDSRIGDDFTSFLSTATGFGNVGLNEGKPFMDMKMGSLDVERVMVSGRQVNFTMT